MKSKLTAKQEKFIQNIVNGMSQREAYKNSYNAENMKDATIDKRASELFAKGEIKGRYEELLNKLEDEAIMSAKERMKWLTGVLRGDIKETYTWDGEERETTPSMISKLKAMDILNKMSGEYVTKIDADVSSEVNISIELTDD